MGAGLSGLAAAIVLAKAGKEVHVHDIRADSGARFDGDFQALENWSMDEDFFDQLEGWGFDASSFKSTSFSVVDLIHPDDEITQAKSDGVAYRIVERGTSDHTIDQAFKRMAIEAGATLHYKSRIAQKDADIVACGPKDTSAIALGEIFHTTHPNHIAFQLNDKLAPGAYSYLIIIDGVGLICTCLWRKQKKSERFLNETIACYQRLYPEIDINPIKRVGGKGDFEKIDTKIIFSTIVEFNNEKLVKEEMEKTILVDVPSKIYPELRQIFIFLFENSGFKDIKINETVNFEKLYKMRKVQ